MPARKLSFQAFSEPSKASPSSKRLGKIALPVVKKARKPKAPATIGHRRHPVEQRVRDIYNGAAKVRVVKVDGRTDDELLADILGSAHRPLY